MARNSNGFLSTDTELIGFGGGKEYSGASGIYVDNENNVISITGDVGKEYNGIEPIVVNNEENLISANSAPIGVQEPLYFVQDDDEAVIIGLSGEYVTPSDIAGKLDTSSFESWQQGQYTNDLTAINEKINEVSSNIPSLEGLATEQLVEETSASIVSQIPSTAGLASETYVQEQISAKASKSDLESVSGDIVNLIPDVSNYYTKDETSGAAQLAEAFSQIGPGGDEEVNALVHSNSAAWNEVSSKLDESTFQEASGLFLTAIPQEYITESDIPNFISAKLDTSSFADVSGSFLTAHQDLSGYATTATTNTLSEQIEELSGTISAKHTLSAGEGISFYEDDVNNITRIDCTVTGGAGDEEVNQAVHTNSATWNTVTDKLDTTSFSDVSGNWVSGTNVVFKPGYEGSPRGRFYSATISGDFVVTTGTYFNDDIHPSKIYSLSSIGNNISNKLDKNIIEDSNTIKIIDGYAEVTNKAYRPTGFTTISADGINFNSDYISVIFSLHDDYDGLFSAKVIVETTNSGEVPDSWSLVSYENNSAIFTKYYSLNKTMDDFRLRWNKGWGTFTNCEASATVYSSVEMSTLAFKDEIPSTANFYTNDNPSGFITGVDLSPYQTIEGMTAYQPAGSYATTAEVDSISSMLSGAIDYVSANAGDEFPASADEAIQYVQTNSANIDETVTSYQTNSGTFLTAHQPISAEEWNDCYDNVNTNSGAWGGSALPISAGPGIGLSMVDGVLVISVTGGN